ncbi:unnamed protein product [Durusdinium trenchii]|uniref:Uncharacterized protein n=1 Tax=Durusdinium trenchii TaxID=1381693 RepID=A0ABP0LKS4_9DINO
MASGLAGKVRRARESDEFDLSGYDQARCQELAKDAFSEPFPLKEMVRISFVVGGGKLVRQKYSDDLPKHMVNALSAVGFQEDNSATVELSSAGKFKYHHDTNKNLKFVHVFPKLMEEAATAARPEGEEEAAEAPRGAPKTPEELLLQSDEADFTRYLQTHLVTYAQKQKLLELLKHRIAALEEIEGKMSRLEKMTSEEEQLFEAVGAEELREKVKQTRSELQNMVDAKRLTSAEKSDFLEQLESKIALTKEELSKAEADGKSKKAQALSEHLEVMHSTRSSIKSAEPAPLPPLKHGEQIRKLRLKLAELAQLEKDKRGNYSLDELKRLGERPELQEAVEELERRAKGWLESDEVFEERLQANLRLGGKAKAAPRATGGYSTVTGGAKPAKAKAKAPGTRNAFGALG